MKNKVKRTIYLLLVAVILFSFSMVLKADPNSMWMGLLRGAGFGLALAGTISLVMIIVEYIRTSK